MEQRVAERTAELTAVNGQLLQATREADQANHSKTKFLAAASHDLLQPMNAARLFAASLSEQPLDHKNAQLVQALTYSLEDMESLLAALVDISKLDAGVVKPDITSFRAASLLDILGNEYLSLATDADLGFRFVSSSAVVTSDMQLLARILRNFLSNAIRYTQQGRVLLGCRRTNQGLAIEVWDTGIGIEQSKLVEVFEEFNRVNPDQGGGDKGLGLGLAIVDKMAGVLNHQIRVHSEPGRGSCFSVLVPYGELQQGNRSREQPVAALGNEQFAGKRILVLDNEQAICQGMQTLLQGWGCEVVTALSLQQVLAHTPWMQEGLDLIVADYHLDNGCNGLDAVAELAALTGLAPPVLLITANYSNDLKQVVRERGYRLLNKPVRPAKLKAVAQHLFSSQDRPQVSNKEVEKRAV